MEFYLLKLVTISFILVVMLYSDSGLPLTALVIIVRGERGSGSSGVLSTYLVSPTTAQTGSVRREPVHVVILWI